jgi:hypothetical protein
VQFLSRKGVGNSPHQKNITRQRQAESFDKRQPARAGAVEQVS